MCRATGDARSSYKSQGPGTPETRLLFVLFLLLLLSFIFRKRFGDELRRGAVGVGRGLLADHFLLLPVLDALPSPPKQFPPIGRSIFQSG